MGLSRIWLPFSDASRPRLVKKISQEMATPSVPTGVSSTAGPAPALASRLGRPAPSPAMLSISPRNGTYSPNGTLPTFS